MKTLKLIVLIFIVIGFTSGCITVRTAMTKDGSTYIFRQRSDSFYNYRHNECIKFNNMGLYKITIKRTSPHKKYDFHPALLVSMGRAYIELGEIDKGIYYLEKSLNVQANSNDSSYLFALYNLGIVYKVYKNDRQQSAYYLDTCITEGRDFINRYRRNNVKSVYCFEQKDPSTKGFKRITFVTKSSEHWIVNQAEHRNEQMQNGEAFSFETLEPFVAAVSNTKDTGYIHYTKKPYGYKNRR